MADSGPGTGQGDTRSEINSVAGGVIQARDVSGGVHFHQADPLQVPVPRQLPGAVPDFTGRRADLAMLDSLLPRPDRQSMATPGAPEAVVISAIDGAAGIGKTALAVYWAHSVRERFPDGTLYVNLQGYGPGRPVEPYEVLDGFLRALGVAPGRIPAGLDDRAAFYRSLLDGRRVLVVLDNANNAAQVRPLLPASRTCLALVTSTTARDLGTGASDGSSDLAWLRL